MYIKKIFVTGVILAALGIASPAFAQEDTTKKVKTGVKKAWKGTKKVAKKVGDETAETATKVKAKTTDAKSTEWVGPDGEDIYIDDGSKFYWISEKGKKMFVPKDQLKAKMQ